MDTCNSPRHAPIAFTYDGVEVRCPLCRALDEIEILGKAESILQAMRDVIEDFTTVLKNTQEFAKELARL